MVKPPFPPFLTIFIWKYYPNEIQDKHTKNSQEKVISSKQHFMSCISDNFVSNTGRDLIQNNHHFRHHKELKEKQVQLHWPLGIENSKIQIRVSV